MPRCNGSYIGIDANPNANVASGIWTVREAETLLRANQWPATPTVPSAPTGTVGDEQVALTWTAPTGGSTPTDYEVQYSSNGGSTWTTFSDGVSTETSAIVTGLTNGTGYIFRVRAVNALGEGPYGSASGTVTPDSGILLGTSLLLHFDGANGSTTFTDSSPNNLTVTANGNAQISTAQSKFGGSSGYLGAPGDSLSLSAASLTIAVDEDFTMEAWIYLPTGVDFVELFGMDGKNYFIVDPAGIYLNGDNDPQITANYEFPTDVWQHVAVTRANNTLRVFVAGQIVHTASESKTYFTQSPTLTIGRQNDGGPSASSYIDELRIVVGTAVYTGNFTPPTGPY